MTDGLVRPPVEFERTSCTCTGCTRYCHEVPGYLLPSDLFRIADHLVATGRITETKQVMDHLRASKGAVVGRGEKRWRIGTITPRMENGRCVFLTEDDRCSIHAVSPFGCSYFSSHDDRAEADIRSLWGLSLIAQTPAYEEARQTLIKRDGEAAEPFTPTKEDPQ